MRLPSLLKAHRVDRAVEGLRREEPLGANERPGAPAKRYQEMTAGES